MVTICDDGYAKFHFYRPKASQVYLAGDFNEWRTDQLRMVPVGDGYWTLKVRLPEGDYKFRYLADGFWYTDFAAFGVEPGRFGMDSLLRMPQRTVKLHLAGLQTQAPGAAAA